MRNFIAGLLTEVTCVNTVTQNITETVDPDYVNDLRIACNGGVREGADSAFSYTITENNKLTIICK